MHFTEVLSEMEVHYEGPGEDGGIPWGPEDGGDTMEGPEEDGGDTMGVVLRRDEVTPWSGPEEEEVHSWRVLRMEVTEGPVR